MAVVIFESSQMFYTVGERHHSPTATKQHSIAVSYYHYSYDDHCGYVRDIYGLSSLLSVLSVEQPTNGSGKRRAATTYAK